MSALNSFLFLICIFLIMTKLLMKQAEKVNIVGTIVYYYKIVLKIIKNRKNRL